VSPTAGKSAKSEEVDLEGGRARGRQKKKVGGPRGGWVGQRPKKDQGQIYLFDIFCGVFELPSPRNSQKRDKKKTDKKMVLDFWSIFL
jgi:hypothetical protein